MRAGGGVAKIFADIGEDTTYLPGEEGRQKAVEI